MRGRFLCLMLVLSVLLSACAANTPEKIDQPFVLYYPSEEIQTEDGVLCTQTISLDPASVTLMQLMQAYLDAETPKGAAQLLPSSWILQSAEMEGSTACLTFSGTESTPFGNYMLAACLTKTLTQLDSIESVSLMAPGLEEPIQLTLNEILFEDTGMLPQKESIILYLPDAEHRYLVRQLQTVEAIDASAKPQYILECLINPENSCIPPQTKLLGVSIESGICTVNLSSDFLEDMEQSYSCERLAVYSIVNTLTELPEINTVDFWIEGAPPERLTFMSLQNSFVRDGSILSSSDPNAVDVDLYVSCDGESLIMLPQTLMITEQDNAPALILNALISFDGANGAERCVPEGTKLLSLRMEGSACIVDLTSEFLDGCESVQEERLAVRSIVATMCALDGISTVEILVEGLEPTYRITGMHNIRQPEDSWFAEQ